MSRYAIFTLLFASLAGCYTAPAPPPIVIGHVADKTRLDKAGEHAEQGIRLALHELNKDGALTEALGGRAIQVRHTDTRGNLDAYEAEAVRLVSINRALALFGGLTARESASLDHVQVPLFTFHGRPAAGAGSQVFYLGMSPTFQGEVLAKFAAEDAKTKRIVFLTDERRPESAVLAESFQTTFTDTRKPAEAKFLTLRFGKDAPWGELLVRLIAQEPSAIVFAGTAHDFNAFHKKYRATTTADSALLIFAGDDGAERSFDLDSEGKARVVLATAFVPNASGEKSLPFTKAYQEAYKTEANVDAALGYEGFRVLADALKRAHPSLTPERLRDELQKTKDFAGLTGPLSVNADRQVQRTLFVARWQNGALTHPKAYSQTEKKE